MTYASLRRSLLSGEISCESVVERSLAALSARRDLNAFIDVDEEGLRAGARDTDGYLRKGEQRPLSGMVIGVKDNICVAGRRLTCGSKILERYVSPYDATVVRRLRNAGALILGKTNLDEFAMGSSNEHSAFGPVRHPDDPSRVPGGSSGGSAAAVAAGIVHAALGSDTGGSVRQPAAFCGVVGLKPTYGRVSRYGLAAFASSFDQIGPIAPTVGDAALVYEAIAGHDPLDSTSSSEPVRTWDPGASGGVKGIRVGIVREYDSNAVEPPVRTAVERAADRLGKMGASVRSVSLPHAGYTIPAYYILTTAEASSNLARYDGVRYGRRSDSPADIEDLYVSSRTEGLGPEVKRRIMLGTYVLSAGYYDAYYLKGQRVRRLICDDFARVFGDVDCLLTPTTPGTAFRLAEKTSDPLSMYLSDMFTVPANLAGLPALSVPFGADEQGLPVGVQMIGRPFDETRLFSLGAALEEPRNGYHIHNS